MKQDIRKPDFFIVGAPKCGTTAMADYLGQHPDIFVPKAKDSHFFGSDLNFINNISHPPNRFRVNEKTYLTWFVGRKEKRLGEASVMYLYSKMAAMEIKRFNPHANIIIMLRNPVDMLFSLHSHFLSDLNEDIEDFEEALKAAEDRKRGLRVPETAYLVDSLLYRDVAKFTEQVQRYLEVFNHKNVHIIIFDDFIVNTPEIYARALRFLGVNQGFQPNFQLINPAKQLRSTTLQRFFIQPPGVLMHIGKVLSRVLWLSSFVKKTLFLLNVKHEKRSPIDQKLRRQLQAEFAPEVERLGKLLGLDLTYWSRQ